MAILKLFAWIYSRGENEAFPLLIYFKTPLMPKLIMWNVYRTVK